jgi:hypothetical protein
MEKHLGKQKKFILSHAEPKNALCGRVSHVKVGGKNTNHFALKSWGSMRIEQCIMNIQRKYGLQKLLISANISEPSSNMLQLRSVHAHKFVCLHSNFLPKAALHLQISLNLTWQTALVLLRALCLTSHSAAVLLIHNMLSRISWRTKETRLYGEYEASV